MLKTAVPAKFSGDMLQKGGPEDRVGSKSCSKDWPSHHDHPPPPPKQNRACFFPCTLGAVESRAALTPMSVSRLSFPSSAKLEVRMQAL